MATSCFSDSMFKKAFELLKKDIVQNADKIIVAFLVIAFMDFSLGTVCASKLLCGFPCPFCGLTRAGIKLITFDFESAWALNPLIYYIAILLILWIIHRYLGLISKRLIIALLIVLVITSIPLYVYRLNNLFPHTEPMTYREANLFKILYDIVIRLIGG